MRTGTWQLADISAWVALVPQIVEGWATAFPSHVTPKVHMLRHMADFIYAHRFLSSVSESQIESYHAEFNSLWNLHYKRYARDPPMRFNYCLGVTLSHILQPFALSDGKENDNFNSSAAASRPIRACTI